MLEAFESGLDGRDFKAGFGEDPKRQDPRRRLVVDDQNSPGPSRCRVTGSFILGCGIDFSCVIHFEVGV